MKNGFTVLELIIVVILVGVLSALALPRFFKMIESARNVERDNMIKVIHDAVERCLYFNDDIIHACMFWTNLDIPNPTSSPNSHFIYDLDDLTVGGTPGVWSYRIMTWRNTLDYNGTPSPFYQAYHFSSP